MNRRVCEKRNRPLPTYSPRIRRVVASYQWRPLSRVHQISPAGWPYSVTTPAEADVRTSPSTSNEPILCHVRPPFSVESTQGSSRLHPAIQPCCESAQLMPRIPSEEAVNSKALTTARRRV